MNGIEGENEGRVFANGRIVAHVKIAWGDRIPLDRKERKDLCRNLARLLGGWIERRQEREGPEEEGEPGEPPVVSYCDWFSLVDRPPESEGESDDE